MGATGEQENADAKPGTSCGDAEHNEPSIVGTASAPEHADVQPDTSRNDAAHNEPSTLPTQCDGNEQQPTDAAELKDELPADHADSKGEDQNEVDFMDASPTLNIGLDTQPEDDFDRHLDQLGEVGQNKHDDDNLEQALEVLMEAEYGAVQDSDRNSISQNRSPAVPALMWISARAMRVTQRLQKMLATPSPPTCT